MSSRPTLRLHGGLAVAAALVLVTGAAFIGFAFTPWSIPLGMAASFAVLFGWFWSNSTEHRPPHTPEEDNPVYEEGDTE